MPMTLAVVDGAVMFLVVVARLLVGTAVPAALDGALIGAHALAVTLCGLFAFQFNDLYDLRRVRLFGQFLGRLPGALLMTFVLAGLIEWIVPGFATSARSLGETVLIIGVAV